MILEIRELLSRIDSLDLATTIEKTMINYNLVNKVRDLISSRTTIKINSIDLIINNNLFLLVRIIVRILILINNNYSKTISTLSN